MSNKQKIYAVKKGKETGIFNTWEECKQLVIGYANAEYKSFNNLTDAISYLNDEFIDKKQLTNDELLNQVKKEINTGITVAFVDGSYEDSIKKYSYGAYIQTLINNEIKIFEFCQSYDDEKYLSSRNVSGEIFGVIKTLEWSKENNIKNIKIYYDYIGIEKWADDSWKANTEIALTYKNALSKFRPFFDNIYFQKVIAHTGIEYNEIADRLAKKALLN